MVPLDRKAPPLKEVPVSDLVRSLLDRHSYLALRRVSCEYDRGRLVLRGCLPSYFLKQVAQTVASQVDGVKWVENQIEVLPADARR